MKVGTDSVLLGAWCPIDTNPNSILDIGAGSGILSLMLAQRSNAQQIDALEIDEGAFEQCVDNFESSPWSDRLFCFHAGLDEFVEEPDERYDLIISNPPFFTEKYKSSNSQRDLARFEEALPFEELVAATSLLLAENGTFAVIIPYKEEKRFVDLCEEVALYPQAITHVRGTATTPVKRSLLAFSRSKVNFLKTELTLEIQRHQYTPDYIALTKDFYLKL